jgi:hypothetical protein
LFEAHVFQMCSHGPKAMDPWNNPIYADFVEQRPELDSL